MIRVIRRYGALISVFGVLAKYFRQDKCYGILRIRRPVYARGSQVAQSLKKVGAPNSGRFLRFFKTLAETRGTRFGRAPHSLAKQFPCSINRLKVDSFLLEVFGGPFQSINNCDDLLDCGSLLTDCADRLHGRTSFGCNILKQDDCGFWLEISIN